MPVERQPSVCVSAVVPSWNGAAILAKHLGRIVEELGTVRGGGEVVLVDDGSDDGGAALEALARDSGAGHVVRLATNSGFSAASNAGAAMARGRHLFFLNSDVHVEPGCVETLLSVLEPRPEVFAVSPVILNLEEGFPESTSVMRFRRGVFDPCSPGRLGLPPPAEGETRAIAYACGGALLCRRDAFLTLGGFSELYAPFYWDDPDLGWRARRAGLEILEVGGARVLHDHARTIGRLGDRRIKRIYERNRMLFTWVHLSGLSGWLAHLAWLPLRWLAAGARRDPAAAGIALAVMRLPAALRERRRQQPTRALAGSLLAAVRAAGDDGWPPVGGRRGALPG